MTVSTWSAAARPESPLVGWSDEAAAAANIAAALAPTPFVPDTLRVFDRGKVDLQATTATVAAALLTGHELGLTPMASLRSIDVIRGTPALRAVALRALLQRAGHRMWLVESTKTRAIVRGQRAGDDHVQEVVWTTDRAKDLGLTGRENWRKQPQAMLIARATAELARLIAADAILGLPYTTEEVEDSPDGTGPDAAPAADPPPAPPPTKRTARRKTTPQPRTAGGAPSLAPTQASPLGDEPPLDDPPAPTTETPPGPVPGETLITTAQSRALHAGLREIGLTERDEALPEISAWIGRDIASTNELTGREASAAIEAIDRVKTAQALAHAAEQEEEHGYGVQQDLDDWLQGGDGGDDDRPEPDA